MKPSRPLVRFAALCLVAAGCRLEKPDPASEAAAILRKHPAHFQDQLVSLDALAAREAAALEPGSVPATRPLLAESLYAYRVRLAPALASARNDAEKSAALGAFLFDTLGLVPLDSDTSLAASVPSLALAHRRGSCVALTLLYLAMANSLGLSAGPVFLPGHVAVRVHPADGDPFNVETLRRGLVRSDSFYREAFSLGKRPWYSLGRAEPEGALAALLFNMANARLARGETALAAEEYRLVAEFLPGFPEALGNLGVCALRRSERDEAERRFREAFAGDSLSPAAANLGKLGVPVSVPD